MESLLRWGIENSSSPGGSSSDAPPPAPRKDLDPAIIDLILGRPDSELMKDALTKASDEALSEDARVAALDEMEMLVESIDNANDLKKLGMWEPLQNLLTSPSTPDEVRMQTLWVIGTALQNNPSAQNAYLAIEPLPAVLSFLSPSVRSSQLRSKAVYALSGLLKHSASAVSALEEAGGWDALRGALEDSDITVRRKTAFLLSTLLLPNAASTYPPANGTRLHGSTSEPAPAPVHANSHASMLADPAGVDTARATLAALHTHNLLPVLVRALVAPTPHGPDGDSEGDVDLEEKVLRLLHTYVVAHAGEFSDEDKRQVREFIAGKEREGAGEHLGLLEDELHALKDALA
ncbi:Fes1-domain-containing protein [Auriscalpium vulgare]|uniref:Fes1-domain-containing protein n=1 Tax=Auriscalpium vulgare TaxID=40419 RepID=A0ACB8RHK9_9AGAM|nr:Fes1-domain-containing protein [Auriscalpium vulgare]